MSTGCPCCCCCCRPRVRTPPSSALSTPCTSHPSISAATWKAFSGAPVSSEDSAPDPERLVLPMTLVYFFFRRGGPCAWVHGARTDRHPPRTAAPPAHCSTYATIGILPPVNGTMKNLRRGPTHRRSEWDHRAMDGAIFFCCYPSTYDIESSNISRTMIAKTCIAKPSVTARFASAAPIRPSRVCRAVHVRAHCVRDTMRFE